MSTSATYSSDDELGSSSALERHGFGREPSLSSASLSPPPQAAAETPGRAPPRAAASLVTPETPSRVEYAWDLPYRYQLSALILAALVTAAILAAGVAGTLDEPSTSNSVLIWVGTFSLFAVGVGACFSKFHSAVRVLLDVYGLHVTEYARTGRSRGTRSFSLEAVHALEVVTIVEEQLCCYTWHVSGDDGSTRGFRVCPVTTRTAYAPLDLATEDVHDHVGLSPPVTVRANGYDNIRALSDGGGVWLQQRLSIGLVAARPGAPPEVLLETVRTGDDYGASDPPLHLPHVHDTHVPHRRLGLVNHFRAIRERFRPVLAKLSGHDGVHVPLPAVVHGSAELALELLRRRSREPPEDDHAAIRYSIEQAQAQPTNPSFVPLIEIGDYVTLP